MCLLSLWASLHHTNSLFPSPQEDVKNEISIMNQLDHVNLIQLYDAFESKHDIILVME